MRGIRKAFPGVVALDGVDLTLHAGEVHVLLGENGAGKSTLMKILSGAYRKDAGEIVIDGRDADIQSPRDALARGIRIIYQELNLVPHLSVAENIFLGDAPTRALGIIDWRRLHDTDGGVAATISAWTIAPATPLHRLSLAERQMVEIAKALKDAQSTVLVMDEPTSALTAREVDQLFALIERLTARGVAIVYITHRLDEVYRIGQRVTVLRDGRHVATHAAGRDDGAELVRLMANRDIGEHFPESRRQPRGPELLRVERRVARQASCATSASRLHAGEVLGIGGLLGAGRSELARVLAGADPPTAGGSSIDGQPVSLSTPRQAIRRGIGLLPEDRKAEGLVAGLTVARNIALPHGRARAVRPAPARAEAALAEPIVDGSPRQGDATQPVRLLSGGNQQKVVLGKWLAGDARIFIFDEPTRGVDVGAKVEIYNLMNRLTARAPASS